MQRTIVKHIAINFCLAAALAAGCGCGSMHAEHNGEAFEYRDIYLPEYNEKSNSALDLQTIDESWGIWGHNLSTVLPDDPSKQVYAHVGGATEYDQFCFSSPRLFEYICDYIRDNYTFEDSVKFAILPNDNDIVCLCTECKRIGNTKGNASPAVDRLIEKLCKKYPEHTFFTSYYSTTSDVPKSPMPVNSGVLVSAMDYPLAPGETQKEKDFMALLKKWDAVAPDIYIWDYVNNFDDYFTPFPVFTVMQRRLKNYRDAGVTGIFLNGSGQDYSVFSRLKKAVLAEMLINPDIDWKATLKQKAADLYPVAGDDIVDFMIKQEDMVASGGKPLPMYEGVEKALQIYLPEKEFVDFYAKLLRHKDRASGQEREDLIQMTEAMALTALEIKRINGDFTDTEPLKANLKKLIGKDMEYYNEGCWKIGKYITQYESMEEDAAATASTNLLKGATLKARTPLDEDYPDISILTDGRFGISSNYHNGLLLNSPDPQMVIDIPSKPGMKTLKVSLIYNPGFKIGLPEEVYVTVDGVRKPSKVPSRPDEGPGHCFLEFDVAGGSDILLTLKKNPDIKTIALDEIQGF